MEQVKDAKMPRMVEKTSVFNPAAYELETMEVLIRKFEEAMFNSLTSPQSLLVAIETLRQVNSLIAPALHESAAKKIWSKTKEQTKNIRNYVLSNNELEPSDLLIEPEYIKLRENVEAVFDEFNLYRYAVGLGLPVKIKKQSTERISDAVGMA